jgi:hypothetical protein
MKWLIVLAVLIGLALNGLFVWLFCKAIGKDKI